MQVTELNEPIKLQTDFSPGGQVTPPSLQTLAQDLSSEADNNRWESRDGNYEVLHLTVTVTESDDLFQLCFREKDLTWVLEKMRMEGQVFGITLLETRSTRLLRST